MKKKAKPPPVIEWAGCYDKSWKGYITPESFAHPAKMARGLLCRILDHMLAEGWIRKGDTLVDPFGGIGTTGIEGASRGLKVYCCELEPRFCDLMRANFKLHERTWRAFNDPLPVCVPGDSRRLAEVLAGAGVGACVSSPPFADSLGSTDKGFCAKGLAEGAGKWKQRRSAESVERLTADYGTSPGQLGALPEGTLDAALADGVVSSPPFSERHDYADPEKSRKHVEKLKRGKGSKIGGTVIHQNHGTTEGNLSALPPGDVADACVSSPPWEAQMNAGGAGTTNVYRKWCEQNGRDPNKPNALTQNASKQWGEETAGQIGNASGATFWEAAALILRQVHQVLKPGGVAAFVCKMFVRKGALVDFPGQWAALLAACGMPVFLEVRAMLAKEERHLSLFGGEEVKKTERKSFFRRLAEKKGSPEINYESVLFARKPC